MKLFKNIFPIALLLMALHSCVENDPTIEDFPSDKIAFTYEVKGDYQEDFYIGSDIQFTNTSVAKGNAVWDFGDGETSTEAMPIHKYKTAGTYKVSLAVEGEGTNFRNLLISDIFPTVTIDPIKGEGICEVKNTSIHLSVFLPNPEQLEVEYNWTFPEGTTNAEGTKITSFVGVDPGLLTFSNVGSQKIALKTKLGGRALEEGMVNVQVGYNKPAKTLYYAVKGGNLMAYKLISDVSSDMKITPFDLGVKSGQTPMNILCDDSLIYVIDPGKQFTYVDDADGNLGDGKISVVSVDGSIVETLISNGGAKAFDDPFYGYVDKDNKLIYVADRNTGIAKVSLKERNQIVDRTKFPYWVQNDRLNYYKAGIEFGAMNACFTKVDDVWYWAKTYNGMGILRFKESDIQKEAIKAGKTDDPYPIILNGMFIKSFAIDPVRKQAYFVVRSTGDEGAFYATSLSIFSSLKGLSDLKNAVASTICTKVVLHSNDDGKDGEFVDVSQIAVDNETGSVYLGFRAGAVSTLLSGLYKYTPDTKKFECIVPNVEIFGVTINNTKSKLFK
ncbi:MAG: PKD domain-containing protein [Bacteroidaceae bacterium]